jgi:nucleotide-binding universal stress UspA family protein
MIEAAQAPREESPMFASILVAWDGSSHAKRALAEAVDIARTQGATVTLLTVATHVPVWPSPYIPGTPDAELLKAAEEIVEEGRALVPEDVQSSTKTVVGHPGTELLDQAATAGHDLIAMGSRGRGAVLSTVLGSTSHFVLNHGRVPVLVVRDGEGSGDESSVA